MTEPQNMPEPSTRPQSNEPASTDSGAAWQRPAADAQPAAAVTAAQPVVATAPVTAQQSVYGSQPPTGYQAYPAATPLSGGFDGTVPPGSPPAWAMPAAPKPSPIGKIFAGVAAAAILSISSGLVGGVVGANFFGDKE